MQNREFDIRSKTKPSLSRQVVERQRDEQEAQRIRLPQRGPFAPVISGIGDVSSAGVHASMLNRATNGRPSRAGQSLLRLQRQYGNRYVQRVLALARKGTREESAPELEQSIQQARGGGHGIDSQVRGQMESAFGADFGNVRLHTDTQSDTLNRELNARAFTTGQDIFFRQGAYNPGSSSGRQLLAHELTHVVQQDGDNVQRKLTVGQPGDKYEQEADQVARAVMQQEQRPVQRESDEGLVRRQIEEEEEEVQMKSEYSRVQRQVEEEEEEEESVQTKAKDSRVRRQQVGEEKKKEKTELLPPKGPMIGPDTAKKAPKEERECLGISCTAFEYLKKNWGMTPSEKTVRETVKMEISFLVRTKFKEDYKKLIPKLFLYEPIDSWGPEHLKKTALLNKEVEREARERIFKFLYKYDPASVFRGKKDVRTLVESDYAK